MTEFIKRLATSIVLGTLFWISFIFLPPIYFSSILLAILLIIIFFEWQKMFALQGLSYWLILPFYPILPFVLLIYLNQHPLYHELLLDLFVLVARKRLEPISRDEPRRTRIIRGSDAEENRNWTRG